MVESYIGLAEDIIEDVDVLLKDHPELSTGCLGGIRAVAGNLANGLKEHLKNPEHPVHWRHT